MDADRITLKYINNLVENPVEEYITVNRGMTLADLKTRLSEKIQVLPS